MIASKNTIISLIERGFFITKETAVTERVTSAPDGTKVLSYGVGFAGYDIRLGYKFAVPKLCEGCCFSYETSINLDKEQPTPAIFLGTNHGGCSLHRLNPLCTLDGTQKIFTNLEVEPGKALILSPNMMVLGESIELFNMPHDYIGLCFGKSTYARNGVLVNVTPIEPGWKGKLVIEISNVSNCSTVIYPGQGIAQVILIKLDSVSDAYTGNWQNQKGVSSMYEHSNQQNEEDEFGRWNWWGLTQ